MPEPVYTGTLQTFEFSSYYVRAYARVQTNASRKEEKKKQREVAASPKTIAPAKWFRRMPLFQFNEPQNKPWGA